MVDPQGLVIVFSTFNGAMCRFIGSMSLFSSDLFVRFLVPIAISRREGHRPKRLGETELNEHPQGRLFFRDSVNARGIESGDIRISGRDESRS